MNGAKILFALLGALCLLWSGARAVCAAEAKTTRVTVGDIVVDILSDGEFDLDMKMLLPQGPEHEASINKFYPSGKTKISINAFLIRTGGKLILADTGGGRVMGEVAGALSKSLAAAGVTPAQIDVVFLTHAHRDHIGGLADKAAAAFPKAKLVLTKEEQEYWADSANEAKASERAKPNFKLVSASLAPYQGKIRLLADGQELAPGVALSFMPGHTAGHCGLLLSSKGEKLLIWGDLVHAIELQLAYPDIAIAFDTVPADAVKTRKAVLERVAKEGLRVAGAHQLGAETYLIKPRAAGGYELTR